MKICAVFIFLAFYIVTCTAPEVSFSEPPAALYSLIKEAQQLLKNNEMDAAEELLRKALVINPQFFPAYNMLGIMYARKGGRERQGISFFKKSLAIMNRQPAVYKELSGIYLQLGDKDEAWSILQEGVKINPEDFQLNYNLALFALSKKNDPHQAAKFFLKAQEKQPDNVNLLYMTGISYVLAGNKPRVLEYITSLRALKDEYLAVRLEDMMRQREEGQELDVGGL